MREPRRVSLPGPADRSSVGDETARIELSEPVVVAAGPTRAVAGSRGRTSVLGAGLVIVVLVGFMLLRQQPAGTASATSSPAPGQPTSTAATEDAPATFAATDAAPADTSSPLPATDAPTAAPSPTPNASPKPTVKPTAKPTPKLTPAPAPGTLKVIVTVINDDGGTASAADFQVNVSPGACCGTVSPETFSGSESGTDVTIDWGASWTVTIDQPAGYRS